MSMVIKILAAMTVLRFFLKFTSLYLQYQLYAAVNKRDSIYVRVWAESDAKLGAVYVHLAQLADKKGFKFIAHVLAYRAMDLKLSSIFNHLMASSMEITPEAAATLKDVDSPESIDWDSLVKNLPVR